MKRFLVMFISVTVVLAVISLEAFCTSGQNNGQQVAENVHTVTESTDTVRVHIPQTGETKTLGLREYIIGVTVAEMPAEFEHDALCAQALASLSYTLYQKRNGVDLPGDAEISADPGVHQAYCDEEAMHELWGENFSKYYEKIENAVDEILPYEISYNNEPAAAAFHAISPGMTESAETVWGADMPYLISVESSGDRVSPMYSSSQTVNAKEFKAKLGIRSDEAVSFENEVYSDAGTLISVDIMGERYTGSELRSVFGLRSAAITLSCEGDTVKFSVRGYGHGVGLSQYGADYYARHGMNWREIIMHYYPGTEIKER